MKEEKRIFFDIEKHGTLENYLDNHNDINGGAFFNRIRQFYELVGKRYIVPEITVIRVIRKRGDVYYNVAKYEGEIYLENRTSGNKSTTRFRPENVLKRRKWEAIGLFTREVRDSLILIEHKF